MIKEELEKRNLPDLFQMPNGQKIATKEEWETIACPYFKDIIFKEEYERFPAKIEPMIEEKKDACQYRSRIDWPIYMGAVKK